MDHIVINGQTTDRLNVTGNLQITMGSASSTSDPERVNPIYRTYQNIPGSISYNGNSALNYSIDGTSHSATLNSDQITILDDLQQKLDEAPTSGGIDPPDPCSQKGGISTQVCPEGTSTSGLSNENSLETMTDQEIKQWLEAKGYEVKSLGNREFQLTRTYDEGKFAKNMSITSVFDADTGEMNHEYSVTKDENTNSQELPVQ